MHVPEEMKEIGIGEYWAGRPIRDKISDVYGHIVGFTTNGDNELIVNVRWALEPHASIREPDTWAVHPSNLELL